MKIKQIEVESGIGAVISEAPYENTKPYFSQKVIIELDEKDNASEIRKQIREKLHSENMAELEMLRNRLKAELIEKQYQSIRFYEKQGKKYPSVTSILGYDADFGKITEVELLQHAAQGTLREQICVHYLQKKEWINDEKTFIQLYPELKEEVAIISCRGGLKLPIFSETYKKLLEKFGDKIEIETIQESLFNDEDNYAGTLDIYGKYDSKPAILDFKKGGYKIEQLAAYAKAKILQGKPVECMVILPVGETDNKKGYKDPTVNENINTHYNRFLNKRAEFRKRFGV